MDVIRREEYWLGRSLEYPTILTHSVAFSLATCDSQHPVEPAFMAFPAEMAFLADPASPADLAFPADLASPADPAFPAKRLR